MNEKPSKRKRFKAFILQRKLNTLGLLVITLMSAIITLICALKGFARTDVLVIVTLLLPIQSMQDLMHVPGELLTAVQPIFYSDPIDAVKKAIELA